MQWNNDSVKKFGSDIQRLINGLDLTRERTCEMFKEVLLNRQPELQQGAFLAALVASGKLLMNWIRSILLINLKNPLLKIRERVWTS
jgi:hypothetical protein